MTKLRHWRGRLPALAALLAPTLLTSCATLREVAALRDVDFSLAGATDATIGGVSIGSVDSFRDLNVLDAARVGAAFAGGHLPFEATLQVRASNPASNGRARLVGLDWTLFLDDRKTVSGALDQEYVLPPGEPVDVPVRVRLDLLQFFDQQLESLVNLALAAAGHGDPSRIRLEATPSVQTPLGVIRSPTPVRIEYQVSGR